MPEQGPDHTALDSMIAAFPKPSVPMGEAWFMGSEREMYPKLLGDLDALPDDDIMRPLEEITSGSSSFGLLGEWVEWYHYMLPRLLTRRWERTYFQPAERLFSAFMCQHPDAESTSPYSRFRVDALNTLGRYIMSPHFWPAGELDAVNCLSKRTGPNGVAGWCNAGNLLSASVFFCAKYLSANDVEGWFRSAVAIPNRYWQVQMMTWLTGAHPILTGEIRQPAEFPETGTFDVTWDWSHVIRGGEADHPFLPPKNREIIVQVARGMEAEAFFEDLWTDPTMGAIEAELAGMPARFLQLYSGRPA